MLCLTLPLRTRLCIMLSFWRVTAVEEARHLFVSVTNFTSNPQCMRGGTHLGTVVHLTLVYRVIPQKLTDSKTEIGSDHSNSLYKVYNVTYIRNQKSLIRLIFVFHWHERGRPIRSWKEKAHWSWADGSNTSAWVPPPRDQVSVGLWSERFEYCFWLNLAMLVGLPLQNTT